MHGYDYGRPNMPPHPGAEMGPYPPPPDACPPPPYGDPHLPPPPPLLDGYTLTSLDVGGGPGGTPMATPAGPES